jgi:sulfoxide reductase heme-binding subunit YedZ
MNDIVYKNLVEVKGLITNTYILAVITAIVFLGIAILISQMIAYEGSKNARDAVKRRVWFFIIATLDVVLFFMYNYFLIKNKIQPTPVLQDKFLIHSAIATGVTLLVFILLGFILSKLMKRGKFGTIFPSKN